MRYELSGTVMQTVAIDLDPGESVYSLTNSMCWMNDAIAMNTHTGGGFLAGLKRSFSGGSLFITEFTSSGSGHVAFAPRFPGTIMPVWLDAGQDLICRKETFLCAEKSVTLSIAWQKRLGAGFFGGEGFILQKVSGPGTVWLDLSGEVVHRGPRLWRTPARPLRACRHHGSERHLRYRNGAWLQEHAVRGEGLFLATLTGPGHIALQSMPILNLAEEIGRYLPNKQNEGSSASTVATGVAGTLAGGIIGSLFGGSRDDRGT